MTLPVFMYSKKKVLWFGLRCVRKPTFYIHAKTKAHIICLMTAHFISALVSLHQAPGISSLQPSSVAAQPGLCRMETPKMGLLVIGFNFDDGKTVKYQTNINHQQKAKKKIRGTLSKRGWLNQNRSNI